MLTTSCLLLLLPEKREFPYQLAALSGMASNCHLAQAKITVTCVEPTVRVGIKIMLLVNALDLITDGCRPVGILGQPWDESDWS
jgi:hypothetical protein